MRFSKAVVKYRIPILVLALVLMIPSVLGMLGTRINYDMLDYLPSDMDTVIGQDALTWEKPMALVLVLASAWIVTNSQRKR